MSLTLRLNDKKVFLTHLDKVLWPKEAITKYDLIEYYLKVSPYLLPHLKGRFLVFQRFPEGIGAPGFYQKNCPEGSPSWIETVSFRHGKKTTRYIIATGVETLAWLGNQACLEIHPWLSSASSPDFPDFAVFDLDPPQGFLFSRVCRVAVALKKILDERSLRSYPKTSGSRGIQVYLPLLPLYKYDAVRKFVEEILIVLQGKLPAETTLERKISLRENRLYLDYLQNARGKTIVAPYSPRPLSGAPVSTPLTWEEVSRASFIPSSFNLKNIFTRLESTGDLFAPVLEDRQELKF